MARVAWKNCQRNTSVYGPVAFHHCVQHIMTTPKRKGFDLSVWAIVTSTGSLMNSPSYRTLWRGWVRSWGLILVPFVFSAR